MLLITVNRKLSAIHPESEIYPPPPRLVRSKHVQLVGKSRPYGTSLVSCRASCPVRA
jgi:hypothetical protein